MAASAPVGLADRSDRQEGRGYAAALRTFRRLAVLGLVCGGLALPASAAAAVRESPAVERATTPYRASVSCYDRPDWAALVGAGYPDLQGHETDVYALWRYDLRQVALPTRACRALEGWRRARTSALGIWVFVLGHELTHAQQSDLYDAPWGRPFDEVEADCGGYAKFEAIRLALGIRREVSPPPRSFSRCPLKRAHRR
jgi:hypothetical protein